MLDKAVLWEERKQTITIQTAEIRFVPVRMTFLSTMEKRSAFK
jgi:hypothetical protein